MSLMHCNLCDQDIDTDINAEHFQEHIPLEKCEHDNTEVVTFYGNLDEQAASKICHDCGAILYEFNREDFQDE